MYISIHDVDLWWLPLDCSNEELQRLHGLLAPDERTRAERLLGAVERQRFIAARGSLRQLLSCYVNSDPVELCFRYEARGKPRLDAPHAPVFSLAHSGAWMLCAVTYQEVGVDLEQLRPLPNAAALIKRFFAPSEAAQLAELPPDEQHQAFFTCWTRREAYLKARGWGLTLPLPSFAVSLGVNEAPHLLLQDAEAGAPAQWQLHNVQAPSGYVAALVVAGHPN